MGPNLAGEEEDPEAGGTPSSGSCGEAQAWCLSPPQHWSCPQKEGAGPQGRICAAGEVGPLGQTSKVPPGSREETTRRLDKGGNCPHPPDQICCQEGDQGQGPPGVNILGFP